MVVIRVYGSILYATRCWPEAAVGSAATPLAEGHIDAWFEDCARHGVAAVLWQANCGGTLTYPSAHAPLAGDPPLPPRFRIGAEPHEQGWTAGDWAWLGEQCRRFDTLEAAVRAAHRHGVALILNFSVFDLPGVWCTAESWPGGSPLFDRDLWLWSRDQRTRLEGIPCYGDPRLRELRLAEVREALDRGVDGIALGFFSHCDAAAGDEPHRFGFNPCVVEEFRERHGVDVLREPFDAAAWYALHGEHFTRFVQAVSAETRRRGRALLGYARTDGIHGWAGPATPVISQGMAAGGVQIRRHEQHRPAARCPAAPTVRWPSTAVCGPGARAISRRPAFTSSTNGGAGRGWSTPWWRCRRRYPHGLDAAAAMREAAGVPVLVWRKIIACDPDLPADKRAEIAAVRDGAVDGYVLHFMYWTDCRHPRGDYNHPASLLA